MNQLNIPRAKKRTRNEETWARNVTKMANVKGQPHLRTNGLFAPGKQFVDILCSCRPSCSSKFTQVQKQTVFSNYYGLSSHTEQNLYLRGCILNTGSRKNHYTVNVEGTSKLICQKYFLALHAITKSRLKRKVLDKSSNPADLRGKQGNQPKVDQNILNDIRTFLTSQEPRESHYSRSKNQNKFYLESNLCIASLHRDFLQLHPHYRPNCTPPNNFVVKYRFFENIFNHEYNYSFGFPRSDICETCDQLHVQIKSAESQQLQPQLDDLLTTQMDHWLEAEAFYESMKSDKLSTLPPDEFCITFDFEKNLPLPVTNVSSEYFLSQLWIFNLCIHNLRTEEAHMFVYSEHFARKSSNEVISCLKYYIEKIIPQNTQVLHAWADNSFGQNKNRYLLAFLHQLVGDRFREINLNYPIPGHSRTRCDKNFALIEKQKKKNDKFSFPSDWTNLIKSAKPGSPFKILYVEHPLNDDVSDDGTDIVKVQDFKQALEPILKPPLEINLKRKFRFTPK